jgi:cardiolipin synthase
MIALSELVLGTQLVLGTPWQAVAVAIWALGEILAIVFVYRVLTRGGSPASTLLWMVVILAAPWFGLLLYYLMPRRLQLRRLRRVQVRVQQLRQRRARPGTSEEPRDRDGHPISGLQALLATAEEVGLEGGNDAQWLPSGEDFIAAAAAAIAAAQNEVHCVVYIFRPDAAAGLRFLEPADAAREARRDGAVALRLVRQLGLKAAHLAGLRAAGGRAEAFLPLLWKRRPFTVNLRNHRKLLIVDGARRLRRRPQRRRRVLHRPGRPTSALARCDARRCAVRRSTACRTCSSKTGARRPTKCSSRRPAVRRLRLAPRPAASASCAVDPIASSPTFGIALVQAIGEAQTSVELSSPYLVPPPMLLFALQLAAARGVRVRIYTNGPKAEAAILYHAQRSYYERFLEAGIELYETVTSTTTRSCSWSIAGM